MERNVDREILLSIILGEKIDAFCMRELHFEGSRVDGYSFYRFWVLRCSNNISNEKLMEIENDVRRIFHDVVRIITVKTLRTIYICACADNQRMLLNEEVDQRMASLVTYNRYLVAGVTNAKLETDFANISRTIKALVDMSNIVNPLCPTMYYYLEDHRISTMVDPYEINRIIKEYEQGNFELLSKDVDKNVEIIRDNNKKDIFKTEPTSIKRFFVEMITFIIHSAYDYGVDVDKLLDYQDPYQVIFSMDDTPSLKEWFMNACRQLYKASQEQIGHDKMSLIEAIEKYVVDNSCRSGFGVAEIAESFDLSPSYLSSLYSKARNMTIMKYITQIRMEKACGLLKNTMLPIREISEKVGYSSNVYFYSCFKKQFGITPAEYRKT